MEKNIYGIIYIIKNKVNKKVYVGQTTRSFNKRYCCSGLGIERVYKYHKQQSKNLHLFKSIEKYGFDSFEIDEEFDVAYSKEHLDYLEKYYIKLFNSNDKRYGYNKNDGGENCIPNQDTKKKMSKNHRLNNGGVVSDETRMKLRDTMLGRSITWNDKISESLKGKKLTDEHKHKLSMAKKGKPSTRKGIAMTEEQKIKISNSKKGNPQNISESIRQDRSSRAKTMFSVKIICLETNEIFKK